MNELWRTLKVGDRVRVVAWPPELHRDRLHRETIALYEWLVDAGSELTISRIDSFGLPYGRVCRVADGVEYREEIALNHSEIEVA